MTKIQKLKRELKQQIKTKFKNPKSPSELIRMAGMHPEKFKIDKIIEFKNYSKSKHNARICKIMRYLDIYQHGIRTYNRHIPDVVIHNEWQDYLISRNILQIDENEYLIEVADWEKDFED